MTMIQTPPSTNSTVSQRLLSAGFTNQSAPTTRRMIVGVRGQEKTGKTDLALTAPQPIMFFRMDTSAQIVVDKARAKGIEVYDYFVDIPKDGNTGPYLKLWEEYKSHLLLAYQLNQGSVVIDTETAQYQLIRLAKHGKVSGIAERDYQPLYAELNGLIAAAFNASNMTTIFLHRMGRVFRSPEEWEQKGYREMPYSVQANIETIRSDQPQGGMPWFGMTVRDCVQNPMLNNKTYWDNPFEGQPKVRSLEYLLLQMHMGG